MNFKGWLAIAAMMGLLATVARPALAQDAPAAQAAPAGPALTQQQLDQLAAPVALYPDPLLADILTASTYPLEVVEAQRWISDPTHAALGGDDLSAALDSEDWDPSVKALTPFPKILQMMNDHLEWTQQLGEAFLAQEADVMDAVQRLRHRAETAGTLNSSAQQSVASDGDELTISPPPSADIYVPVYDPWCAFGPWPYPVSAPYYFSPWTGYCYPAESLIAFDSGIFLPFAYWEWGYFDWHHHDIRINRGRFDRFRSGHEPAGDVWRHDPSHRVGVPYRDPRNVRQFQPRPDYRQSFRGYEGRDGEAAKPRRAAPPAFENFDSGAAIRVQSERGQLSRQGMSGGPARGFGGSGARGGASHGGRGH